MRTEREYGLMHMNYLPCVIVPFYPLFQEHGAREVERPKTDWEVRHLCTEVRKGCCRIGLRRIIQRRRYTMKSTDPYRNASGAPADEKVDVSDTC